MAMDVYITWMGFDNGFDNGQANTCSTTFSSSAGINTIEADKESFKLIFCNDMDQLIGDNKLDLIIFALELDLDNGCFTGIFNGVEQ